jgi:hypothetical protein
VIAAVVVIALRAAATAAALATASPAPAPLGPAEVLARYAAALHALHEPTTFTVDYTLEQTGTRSLDQTHRIFRRGDNERDEILAVNGTRATTPSVRIFRGHANRYAVARLAPTPAAYAFTYLAPRKTGHHLDYVFGLVSKGSGDFALTQITIDGVTFLPSALVFKTFANAGRGTITFGKNGPWWVVIGATASARVAGGTAHERLTFANWRFPSSLPASTFGVARATPDALTPPG